jgi:CBS domain-containing protein/gamma-glutamylcysteine synthetase
MGSQSVRAITTKKDRKDFVKHLLNDVAAFEHMVANNLFEANIQRVGAEQEICIVKNDYTPSYNALDILTNVNDDHFTTELGLFNLEVNLDPHLLTDYCFSDIEKELLGFMQLANDEANKIEANKIILAGILPTLRIKDLDFKYITPHKRYKTLNNVLKGIRGDEFKLHIQGVDEMKLRHKSILFEACNTSFQVHLQIDVSNAIDMYNWSQAIAGPVLSVMTNSPILLGRELWSETRIALFQQSVDVRNKSHILRGQKPRVSFGSSWVKNSIVELFMDDIVRYAPIVTSDFEADAMVELRKGIMPEMKALNLHNGTLYKWNRLCYGVHKNVAHLRIENRYIPSGPTVKDEIANALFWVGVMQGMPKAYKKIWKQIPFKEAKGNFINAARTGIESHFVWFGKEISAVDLAKNILLPMAREGLKKSNVNENDITQYLGIIEARIDKRQTGSKWITRNKRILSAFYSNYEVNSLLTKKMYEYQQKNIPIHEWKDFDEFPEEIEGSKNKAYKIMSRELYVVHEHDLIELVKKIMEWKHIHHVPVVDTNNKMIGMIDYTAFSKLDFRLSKNKELVAKQIMNQNFVCIHPDTELEKMHVLMSENSISSLAVIHDDELVGIVTSTDLLNAKTTS